LTALGRAGLRRWFAAAASHRGQHKQPEREIPLHRFFAAFGFSGFSI
jgi:hypothetical protein